MIIISIALYIKTDFKDQQELSVGQQRSTILSA
jgi:hypothetical protein